MLEQTPEQVIQAKCWQWSPDIAAFPPTELLVVARIFGKWYAKALVKIL